AGCTGYACRANASKCASSPVDNVHNGYSVRPQLPPLFGDGQRGAVGGMKAVHTCECPFQQHTAYLGTAMRLLRPSRRLRRAVAALLLASGSVGCLQKEKT